MIPKIVHQIWWQEDAPEYVHQSVSAVKAMNENWVHKLWDDRSLRSACGDIDEEVLSCYDGFTLMHQKIDLGRLAVLYLHGGVSLDMDITPVKPLDDLSMPFRIAVSRSPVRSSQNFILSGGMKKACNNALIICEKENDVIRKVINRVIRTKNYQSWISNYFTIQWTTGPFNFSKVIEENRNDVTILDPKYFEFDGSPGRKDPDSIIFHHHTNTWISARFAVVLKCLKFVTSFSERSVQMLMEKSHQFGHRNSITQ